MSFGTNNTSKTAQNNLSGTSNLALNDLYPKATTAGTNLIGNGQNVIQPGVNFFNTLLNGNRDNTTALLQPNIDNIRHGVSDTLTGINTLTPRGGGRFGTNYGMSYAPQAQITNLFNGMRGTAASALPQIGLPMINSGTNLFGIGAGGLNTSVGANTNLSQSGFQAQQMSNSMMAALGSGLFGLATTPFGGGPAANGLLGLLGPQPK